MFKKFQDWSIRHKLIGLFAAMACATAIAVLLPTGAFYLLSLREAMAKDQAILAEVLARNSTAALTFRDAASARDVLQALKAEPTVTAACIYTEDGRPFAKYVRDGDDSNFFPPAVEAPLSRFERKRLILFQKIVLDNEMVGTIYLESDMQRLNARLREYIALFAVTLVGALGLAVLLSSRLQQPISGPLASLVQTAQSISGAADYSIRAKLPNRDEFGLLVSAFNGMLDLIETRDQQLRQNREHLEEEVAHRTAELQSANNQLKLQAAALHAAANSIVITDLKGLIVWSNPAFSVMTGYTLEEVSGKTPRLLSSGKHDREFYKNMWETITSGRIWRGEVTNRRKNGELYQEEMTITPASLQAEGVSHFVAIKQDITERKKAEVALRQAEEKYRAIFEDAVVGIFQMTPDARPISINRALAQMQGFDTPEQYLAEVSDVGAELFVDPERMREFRRRLEADGVVHGAEVEVYTRSRTKKWVLANLRAVRDASGRMVRYEGTVEDITDRKIAEERVQYLAFYDSLTGLPNRTLLQDRVDKAMASAVRHKEKVALLFLDLDRFKTINDSLGHTVGDLLLQQVAERLKNWARAQDTVARIGGDEFLVVLTGIRDTSDAAVAAQRLLTGMTTEFVVQERSFAISCSVGISIFPDHGADAETLVKHADTAMYCAKESGRNTFRFFTDDMNAEVMERLTLEHSLRQAIEKDELFLVYQPQMDLGTGTTIGFEALIRWQHPERGLVRPDKFIRVAEHSGLIVPIGEWVLRTACSTAQEWRRLGLLPVPIAVNVSAVQFRQEGFRDVVEKALRDTGLPPQYLELELTESLLLSNAELTFPVLQELKAMGIKLAIDDFGTGYSSLSYLRQFPVHKLKIDRSFVQEINVNADGASITAAIISMAKSLNLTVIAEGVEDERQLSFLRMHGCDQIQGYYFSKPLLKDEVIEKLRASARTMAASNGSVP